MQPSVNKPWERGGVILETLLLVLLIAMIAAPAAWYIGDGLNYRLGGDRSASEDDSYSGGILPRTGSRGR